MSGEHSMNIIPSVNKTPAGMSSVEIQELRNFLRQDIEDCLQRIVGKEVQDLRQDLWEWLSHPIMLEQKDPPSRQAVMAKGAAALARSGECAPPPEGKRPRISSFRRTLAAAAGGADGQATPSALGSLERDFLPASSGEDVDQACFGAVAEKAQLAGDASPAQGPDGVAPSADHHPGAGHAGEGRRTPEKPEVHRVDTLASGILASTATSVVASGSPRGQSVCWQWEQSPGNWVSYRARESRQIEKKWQSGASRMRVRSGPTGQTPMEIFFVDMIQLNPESGSYTGIRREGVVLSYLTRARRLSKAISYSLKTGEPLWESMGQYKQRQESLPGRKQRMLKPTLSSLSRPQTPTVHRRFLHWVVQDHAFSIFVSSMVITLGWCVCLAIDVQRYPDGRSIYKKDVPFMATELSFTAYFLLELVIRFVACRSVMEFFGDVWNLIDTVCVAGSLVDVVFVPVASTVMGRSGAESSETELAVLRTLRLFKLLRALRLSRASSEVNLFFKALWCGLKESSMVWAILAGMVLVFSILLMTYANEEMREENFSSLGLCMNRLLATGILLDEVAGLFDDMLV